jgi:hypothetical protein
LKSQGHTVNITKGPTLSFVMTRKTPSAFFKRVIEASNDARRTGGAAKEEGEMVAISSFWARMMMRDKMRKASAYTTIPASQRMFLYALGLKVDVTNTITTVHTSPRHALIRRWIERWISGLTAMPARTGGDLKMLL